MKSLLTILTSLLICSNVFADSCRVTKRTLTKVNGRIELSESTQTLQYKLFNNNSEAIAYASEKGLLDNMITDKEKGEYRVFENLPSDTFVCVNATKN